MGLPPLWVTVGAKIGEFQAGMATAEREIARFNKTHTTAMSKFRAGAKIAGVAAGIVGAAMVGAGYEAVKMAADFQTTQQRLTTTAGESVKGLKVVSAGVLDMAGKTGVSAQDLSQALYQVESGGFHGAKALDVLRAAAQGAKVEGSNTTEVAHALAGALNDYAGKNLTAVTATNAMTAAVGAGMMTFNDLAEAFPKIGSRAAAANVTFQETLAAMATMTKDGLPASVAATYLGQTIGQLAAPSAKARTEMKGLGIDATKLSQTLTSGSGHGLGDAIQMLYTGITKHLSPAGLVAVKTFAKSKGSASDYKKMLADLPPSMQTVIGSLSVMAGGVKSMQGVLMLGGAHSKQYAESLKAVNEQVHKGGKSVEGFKEQQKTLNGQLADAKAGLGALAIKIGTDLLPTVTKIIAKISGWVGVMERHKRAVEIAAAVLGGFVVVILAVNAAMAVMAVVTSAAFWPVTLGILVVAALGVAIFELVTHWHLVWTTIKRVTEEAWSAIKHAVSASWEWIKRQFSNAYHWVVDPVAHAWDATKRVFSNGWNAIKQTAQRLGHDVAQAVRGVWDSITRFTTSVWNGISGFFKKWWPLLLEIFMPAVFAVLALWHQYHKKLQDTLKQAWDWIKRHISEAWDAIKKGFSQAVDALMSLWHAIWDPIEQAVTDDWDLIKRVVQAGWDELSRLFRGAVSALNNLWHQIWDPIQQGVSSAWGSISRSVSNGIATVSNVLSPLASKAWHWIVDAFNAVVRQLQNLGSDFEQIGSAIVNGIWSGLSSGWSWLTGKVSDLAGSLLGSAKKALGINSPSKVFADVVGRGIVEGIGKGIADNHHHAVNPLRDLTKTLVGQPLPGAGRLAGVGAGAASAQSGVLELKVPVQFALDGQVLFKTMQTLALKYQIRGGVPAFSLATAR